MELIINNGILTGYRGEPVNVIIPESVTSIGDWAFSNCSSLTSITIPESVTSIGDWTFENCERLTIYGATGSYAKLYAKERNYPFKVKKK